MLSHGEDFDETFEGLEVVRVAGVEREFLRARHRGNEQVDGSRTASLAACSGDRCVHAAVCAGGLCIERQRIEHCLGSLESILASGSFFGVLRRVWSGSEFGHGDRADRGLDGEQTRVEPLEVDDHRGVE